MWLLLTRKHLCWSLFLILSIVKFSEHLFWRTFANGCFWKCVDNKLFIKRINFALKNPDFFNINIRNKWKCLLLFHDWFPVKFLFIHIQYFFDTVFLTMPNIKYLLELIKRRSKIQETNMSCERALNFDKSKTFSEGITHWEFDLACLQI